MDPDAPIATTRVTRSRSSTSVSTRVSAEQHQVSSRKGWRSREPQRNESWHRQSAEGAEKAATKAASSQSETLESDITPGGLADDEQSQQTSDVEVVGGSAGKEQRTRPAVVDARMGDKPMKKHSIQDSERNLSDAEISDHEGYSQKNSPEVEQASDRRNAMHNALHAPLPPSQCGIMVDEEEEDDFEIVDTLQASHLVIGQAARSWSAEKSSASKRQCPDDTATKRYSSGSDRSQTTEASLSGKKLALESSSRNKSKGTAAFLKMKLEYTSKSSRTRDRKAAKKNLGKFKSRSTTIPSETESDNERESTTHQEPQGTDISSQRSASNLSGQVSLSKPHHLNKQEPSVSESGESANRSKGKNKSAKQKQTVRPVRKSLREVSKVNYNEASIAKSNLQTQDSDSESDVFATCARSKKFARRKRLSDIAVGGATSGEETGTSLEGDGEVMSESEPAAVSYSGLMEDVDTSPTVTKHKKQFSGNYLD